MRMKLILTTIALFFVPQLFAGNLFKLVNAPLTIHQCLIKETGNPLDLALVNDGYFIVSSGKKGGSQFFTRFGYFALNSDGYLCTIVGDFLLGIKNTSDPSQLSKIKIPEKNLPPKATNIIKVEVNLPALASAGNKYRSTSIIYDSISNEHVMDIKYRKSGNGTWDIQVFVDEVELGNGTLIFNAKGLLIKQFGLANIQWTTNSDLLVLKVNFAGSTQYATEFCQNRIQHDGYSLGILQAFHITIDGEIGLYYNNGQYRQLKSIIAVAKFINPKQLKYVNYHLYSPTDKSGLPGIHPLNSEHAIMTGFIEEENCLIEQA